MKILVTLMLPALLHGGTYYIDNVRGQDTNAGTSTTSAWRTLAKVNATHFAPGDRVLFRSGGIWQGQLAPASSGAEGSPIVFGRYGRGPKPHIDGAGQVEDEPRLGSALHPGSNL